MTTKNLTAMEDESGAIPAPEGGPALSFADWSAAWINKRGYPPASHEVYAALAAQPQSTYPADASKSSSAIDAYTAEGATPCGWFEGPHGAFRANPAFKFEWPPQSLSWQMPVYLHGAQPQATPDEFERGRRAGITQVHDSMLAKSPAEAHQKPLAWAREWDGDDSELGNMLVVFEEAETRDGHAWTPLYSQAQPKGLSDAQMDAAWKVIEAKAQSGDASAGTSEFHTFCGDYGNWYYLLNQCLQAAQCHATRDAALEEAAQLCERWNTTPGRKLAGEIRALATQAPAPGAEPTGWVVYWGQPPIRKHSIHFERATAEAVASEIKSCDARIDPVFSASPAVGAVTDDFAAHTVLSGTARYKVKDLIASGYRICGYTMERPGHRSAVVFDAAVRWLSEDQRHTLMFVEGARVVGRPSTDADIRRAANMSWEESPASGREQVVLTEAEFGRAVRRVFDVLSSSPPVQPTGGANG